MCATPLIGAECGTSDRDVRQVAARGAQGRRRDGGDLLAEPRRGLAVPLSRHAPRRPARAEGGAVRRRAHPRRACRAWCASRPIRKPERDDRGAIEVEFVRQQEFKIEGVYLDPIVGEEAPGRCSRAGSTSCSTGRRAAARRCWRARSPSRSGWSSSSSTAARWSRRPTSWRPSRCARRRPARRSPTSSRPTCSLALEEAGEHPERRYLVFLDEFNRCQESARNALMPALDSTRRVFHPIENRSSPIPDNVQFIAAVNRGSEFSGTFGIDAAQLDRFAPLQMDYPPPEEEVKLLRARHPELSEKLDRADGRRSPTASATRRSCRAALSVRATDEACIYLKHPLIEGEQRQHAAGGAEVVVLRPLRRPVERRVHRRRRGVGGRCRARCASPARLRLRREEARRIASLCLGAFRRSSRSSTSPLRRPPRASSSRRRSASVGLWVLAASVARRRGARTALAAACALLLSVQIGFFRYYHVFLDEDATGAARHMWRDVRPTVLHVLPERPRRRGARVRLRVRRARVRRAGRTARAHRRARRTRRRGVLPAAASRRVAGPRGALVAARALPVSRGARRVERAGPRAPFARLAPAERALSSVDESVRARTTTTSPRPRRRHSRVGGVDFHEMRSVASYTSIAIASLFTSLPPTEREPVIQSAPYVFDFARMPSHNVTSASTSRTSPRKRVALRAP